ncbi:putative agamous-like MADS-box protein AGL80-like [Capsicum annuum]|uniref:VQ domain-containing protein n=1 Tax=Capsicum annuum TaxID=4072 RepID=A0A1U8F1T8_CAPAN|nr:uncharacterized protein LOC107849568 [Capsicum annuum]XP_016549611.1 uncharacterized protein LOC107849568 [Capsicum annuum]KAF3614633.1 putative agamous-like MADS-box protein AGL80-like [Capsicum annuum]KAF3633173.1 putative agamous-like MADS-box protein AGL80-like [Capsicum annuum]PHT66046.1 hypothetical protein T459_30471 [Capsicum annuum]
MDSCNSGSVQSSSGDDKEYDSHHGASSISTFLNSSSHFGSLISSSPLPQFLSQQSSLFDPYDTQNFNSSFQDSTNSPYNNDLVWHKDIRSNHPNNNFNNFGNLTSSSSIAPTHHQGPHYDSTSIPINPSNIVQPKNPKKRSRASRRAPTTVLTTDTTNFRQMVQEFTGIPTTPFTGSAYTRRFDLFSTASSSMKRSANLDNVGALNYTIRPSTQKVQNSQFMPLFLSSSVINDTLLPTNNNIVGATNASTFGQISKSFTSTIPCLDEMVMKHHDQVDASHGGFDQYDQRGASGGEERSRKDRNISRLLFDGNI